MKMAHIAGKIPQDWHSQILAIREATGLSESEVLREAIALYLKRAKAPTVRSRLDALEAKIEKLTAMILQ